MFIFQRQNHLVDSPNLRIMKALKIGSKDVEVNREGEISPLQKKRFRDNFRSLMVIMGLSILCVAVSFVIAFRSYRVIPVVLVIFGIAVLGGVYALYRHRKNLSTGQVVAFTGRIKKYVTGGQKLIIVTDYEDRNERIFKVEPRIYNAFVEEETYTVYFPSYWSDKILSAEHIPM